MSDLKPFLQNLRDRLTVAEVIRPHVRLNRKGHEHTGLCPFHKEKSPSFKVNDEKGFYHCFGCGAHGDIFDFIMQKQNMPFMEAVEFLAGLAGLEVPKRTASTSASPAQPKADTALYEVLEAACQWYERQLTLTTGAPARAYLEQRCVLPETIGEFRLGYAPERGLEEALLQKGFAKPLLQEAGLIGVSQDRNETYDRFRGRLMFPIWDARGRVIAFGGRILREGEPKYLNSPETPAFSKGKTLYAYHKAVPVARQGEPMVVVEGYMDVIALHQAGFRSAVGPLGTALTPEQMALLWRVTEAPVLCFDGDEAGTRAAHRAARRAVEILKVGLTLHFCFLPGEQDPDSLLREGRREELSRLLGNPQPLVDVLWTIFREGRHFSTPEQKASARKEIGDMVAEFRDPDVRHFYRQELNNRFQGLLEFHRAQEYSQIYKKRGASGKSLSPFSASTAGLAPALHNPPRAVGNKNQLGQKILLATLLNHPTLIEEIAESLMQIGEGVQEYQELRQAILSVVAENLPLAALELQGLLQEKGFAPVLAEVLTPQIYSHAPFARPGATQEEALAGWREVWQRTVVKPYLTTETTLTATAVREQLDEQSWERYKTLKNQVIFKEDEKKGV